MFAIVWSIGASTANDGRQAFDILIKELANVSKVFIYSSVLLTIGTFVRINPKKIPYFRTSGTS